MKKNIILLILVTIIAIVEISYLISQTQLMRLGSVTLNGQVYETTGAIPAEDVNARNLSLQTVKLADMGDVTTQNFKLSVDNNGMVNITLYPPYDASKQAAFDWLKSNGFNLITEDRIVFTDSP